MLPMHKKKMTPELSKLHSYDDNLILDAIADILHDPDWSPDTLNDIYDLVALTGRLPL
jgi:hypothetical protein